MIFSRLMTNTFPWHFTSILNQCKLIMFKIVNCIRRKVVWRQISEYSGFLTKNILKQLSFRGKGAIIVSILKVVFVFICLG